MRKIVLVIIALVTISQVNAQRNDNEIALVVSPLKFKEQSSYQALYRSSLRNEDWSLRTGIRLLVDTDKETRSDSLITEGGTVQYDLSVGIQRKLAVDDLEKLYLYGASDLYLNSEFRRETYETYYGYYWNIGVAPLVGISYEPFDNIRLSMESRADLNFNFQKYDAQGVNKDQRVSFSPLKQLAIGIGYLF